MYLIYNLHLKTLNLTPKSIYANRQEALDNFRNDANQFMSNYNSCYNIIYILKKKELDNLNDGYYLKISNKYPNRITVYDKSTSIQPGYVYNSNEIKIQKIMIFSILEISDTLFSGDESNIQDNICIKSSSNYNLQHGLHVKFIEELKFYLEKRRKSILGKME